MRWIAVILALTVVAVGVVQLRAAELRMRNEVQVERAKQVRLQRTLWDQQVALSELTSPQHAEQLVEAMGLDLTEKGNVAGGLSTPRYAFVDGR